MTKKLFEKLDTIDNSIKYFVWVFWTGGFMFTVGLVGVPDSIMKMVWYQQIVAWIIGWLIWPLTLGMHFSTAWIK